MYLSLQIKICDADADGVYLETGTLAWFLFAPLWSCCLDVFHVQTVKLMPYDVCIAFATAGTVSFFWGICLYVYDMHIK